MVEAALVLAGGTVDCPGVSEMDVGIAVDVSAPGSRNCDGAGAGGGFVVLEAGSSLLWPAIGRD